MLHPLERYRVNAGLGQAEAARQAGLNPKTLYNAEHGLTGLAMPTVNKLAKLYDVDPGELLEEVRAHLSQAAA